jgi:hypothetical protein
MQNDEYLNRLTKKNTTNPNEIPNAQLRFNAPSSGMPSSINMNK